METTLMLVILAVILCYLSSSEWKALKDLGVNGSWTLCDANPVLYQLSYQVHWKLVVMWVNDKQASR